MKKEVCYKCKKLATWWYMPSCRISEQDHCCNDCVPRGCSCAIDDNGNYFIDPYDPLNRPEPCCEWNYNEDGYDVDIESSQEYSEGNDYSI